jgi:hypothetical protein
MNTNSIFSSAVLAAGIVATGFALPASAADKMDGDARTGSATVKLQFVHAVQSTGAADPKHDAACKKQLSGVNSKYIGMKVKTDYSINTKTLMMSAKSMFPSPHSTQPLELTVNLNALGIAKTYAFGTFKPAELPEAYAVLFSISEKFTDPKSTFVVYGPKGQEYNCVISSAKATFKTAESSKFGIDKDAK